MFANIARLLCNLIYLNCLNVAKLVVYSSFFYKFALYNEIGQICPLSVYRDI